MPKERIEVVGGGRMAVIDDFRVVQLAANGKIRKTRVAGKGHVEELAAFARTLKSGEGWPISWEDQLAVSTAAILAVRSLREGSPFVI